MSLIAVLCCQPCTYTALHKLNLPCAILERVDFLALLSFSLTSAHETRASFFSSIEDESDCVVETDDRVGWRVELDRALDTAAELGSRRLGSMKVILVDVWLDRWCVYGVMVEECFQECFYGRISW